MKKRAVILLTMLNLAILGVSAQNPSGKIEGNWLGTIELGGTKLRLVLKISGNADRLTAKLDSIDQGVKDLTVDSILMKSGKLQFAVERLGLSYEGALNDAGDEIKGIFKQGSAAFPLLFRKGAEIPRLNRPQEPQRPFPYIEEEVAYTNSKDNTKLAGTLSIPKSLGKHPAVILISGSGAQDRDQTIAGHRPFLVLSDFLTRRGIAVLRIDDRGVGASGRGSAIDTSEDFAGDVLAGVTFLKKRSEIDPSSIGLIGHSEGGMIAPMVAVRSNDVAFIVLLAGTGQTGEDVIYTQTEELQKAQGISPEVRTRTIELMKKVFAIVKAEPDNATAEKLIRQTIENDKASRSEEQNNAFSQMRSLISSQVSMYLSAWFRYFIAYDPRPTLEKVKVPVLALNGENDLQVPAKVNLGLIENALKAGNNREVTIKSIPKLNHLFQTSQTGAVSEYGVIEETMAHAVLETIAGWITERTRK